MGREQCKGYGMWEREKEMTVIKWALTLRSKGSSIHNSHQHVHLPIL